MQYREKEVEYLGLCPSGEDDILKHIESCGRRCYRSAHKIDWENRSFEKFYRMLTGHGHLAAIEHSNIVVELQVETQEAFDTVYTSFVMSALYNMQYFRLMPNEEEFKITISGNVRAWLEFFESKYWFSLYFDLGNFLNEEYPIVFEKINGYLDINRDLREAIPDIENDRAVAGSVTMRIVTDEEQSLNYEVYDAYDIPIYTFAVYTDRGITHEIVRHRVMSYAQESTRYCNYKKIGGIEMIPFEFPPELTEKYEAYVAQGEALYNDMLSAGVKPQLARNVLPHSLKTEISISGRMSGWRHFVKLRDSGYAHPDIRFVAREVKDALGIEGPVDEAA